MTTIEILKAARQVIEKPEHWTQGQYARTAENAGVSYSNPRAFCFCSQGAILKASHDQSLKGTAEFSYNKDDLVPEIDEAITRLDQFCVGGGIEQFNDAPGRTHAEVLAKFDEAIASLETQGYG